MLERIQSRFLLISLFSLLFVLLSSVSSDSLAEGSIDPITGAISGVDITGALPYRGSAPAGGKSFYVVKGLTSGTKYTISVHSLTQSISLNGYKEATIYSPSCSSNRTGLSNEACSLSANVNGELYIKIDAYFASVDAAYTIEILPPPVDEGTLETPLDIGGVLPHSGTVTTDGNSYYVVSGLTPGSIYNINLTNVIGYPTLFGYPHKDFINPGTFTSLCWSTNNGWADETCQLTANFDGKVYIKVTDYNSFIAPGSYYKVSVSPTGQSERYFEGYVDAPILLNNLVYRGQSYRYPSNYRYSNLVPGQRYEIHVKNYVNRTYLNVFTDYGDTVGSTCSASSYNTAGADMWCVAKANSLGQLNFNVAGYDNDGGTRYDLQLATAPVAEGSVLEPKRITMPYDGQVDETNSYYVIPGLKPNWVYEVVTTQTTRNLSIQAGSDINNLEYRNIGRSNAKGELFFKARTGYMDGAWFSVELGDANNPEGSVVSPVDISSSSDVSPYHGQLDNTVSYYVVKGLIPGAFYTAHVNGVSNINPDMIVYADPSFTNKLCSDDFIFTTNEGHCLAPANADGELYILMLNDTYHIEGTGYNLWLAPSLLKTQGTVSEPINIDQGSVVDAGGNITYQGMVSAFRGKNESYYRVRMDTRGGQGFYRVSLTGMTDNVNLNVTNHLDSAAKTDFCFSSYPNLVEESCIIQSQLIKGKVKYADIIIKVSTTIESNSNTYWDGAAFTIKVEPVNEADVRTIEGSWAEPKDITGLLPYQGHVDNYRYSSYKIAGLNPNERFEVRVNTNRDSMEMRVFDSNTTNWDLCSVRFSTVPGPEGNISCQATASSIGELYVRVEDNDSVYSSSDIPFEVDIKSIPQAEGSLTTPLDITGQLPRASQVGGLLNTDGFYTQGEVNSYYKVGGLLPDTEYQVLINKTSGKISYYNALKVYQDPDMTMVSCDETSFLNMGCRAVSNSYGELYIHIDGYWDRSQSGSYFDINVRTLPKAEGSVDTPVVIGTGYYQGQHAGAPSSSYYKVTGLTPNRSQRVAIQNDSVTTEITLYGAPDYKYELCRVDTGFGPTGCSAAANSDGELYIKINSDEAYKEGADAGIFELLIP